MWHPGGAFAILQTKAIHGERTMSLIVSEVYDALIEAGTSEAKAKAAAGAIPLAEHLATKGDLAEVKADLIKWMVGALIAQGGVIVALLKLLPG